MSDATPDMDMLVRGLIHLLDVVPGEPAGHFTGARKARWHWPRIWSARWSARP